jgi:hypothetical protein
MRMRRARYPAGDDAFPEADSARDWMCGPAIPTQTCAPARHVGLSTNDCMDLQAPFIAAWLARSRCVAVSRRPRRRRESWRRYQASSRRGAQLAGQDKSREVRPVGSGKMTGTSRDVRLAPQPAKFDKALRDRC